MSRRAGTLVAAILAGCWLPAEANIEVACRLAQPRVMQYEPIVATVAVRNRTSERIRLSDGGDGPVLSFIVERSPGRPVARTERPLLAEPLTIDPWDEVQFEVNLLPRFELFSQGPHTVIAVVQWQGEAKASSRLFLDILPGMEVHRARVALSGADAGSRVLSLRTLSRGRHEHLFLRIDDEERNICFGAFDLGSILRMFSPVVEVDGWDRVHVLHQSAPARFTRTVITADGIPEDQAFYSPGGERPRLVLDSSGRVVVTGLRAYVGDPYVAPGRIDSRRRGP